MSRINTSDPNVAQYLAEKIGYQPPFSSSDIAMLDVVAMKYASDTAALAHCRNLRILTLSCCELGELSWFPKPDVVAELSNVTFSYSTLTTLEPFRDHPALARVNITDTLVTDLSPLFTLPQLRSVTVRGCPLSDEAFHEQLPRLREHVPDGRQRPPKVGDYPEPDWRLTRLIQSRGIRAVYSQGKALAPGLAYSDFPDLHSYRVSHDDVKRVLDEVEDGDLHGFMDRCKQIAFSK